MCDFSYPACFFISTASPQLTTSDEDDYECVLSCVCISINSTTTEIAIATPTRKISLLSQMTMTCSFTGFKFGFDGLIGLEQEVEYDS